MLFFPNTSIRTRVTLPADTLGDFEHYQITKEIMAMANENAILNPCLPFYCGEEVSENVIDSDDIAAYQLLVVKNPLSVIGKKGMKMLYLI